MFLGNVFRVPLAKIFGMIELMGTREGSEPYVLLVENETGGKKYTSKTKVFVG